MPPIQDLLLSNPPLLSEQLRRRADQLLSGIVKANYSTQFAQTASELADFRHVTAGLVDSMDDDTLSELFRKTVYLTTYDLYAPFIARFFEEPCKASAIIDLLSPGIPDYIAESSSTSGGLAKNFPKYNYLSEMRSEDLKPWATSDPLRRRTRAYMRYLGIFYRKDVEDDNGCSTATIYMACGSTIIPRTSMCLDPEKDKEKVGAFIFDHAAPYAAVFIKKWRTFLLIQILFAISSRSLETMDMIFINTFVDMMRYLDMEFDMVVNCIENGTIPDLEGLDEVRDYLELNMLPDCERAAELRRIGRPSSRPGWCGHVWPHLRLVYAIASGCFASSIPLAEWFLGPDADICTQGYRSTEALIGSSYDPLELNQFRPNSDIIIEFLDISKSDSITSIAQSWEVEPGRRYEPLLTTRDGLWRYRLRDVVEISGFDPTDGVPIMQFIERRSMAIRLPDTMVTETDLRAAMLTMPVKFVNWTATTDEQHLPATIGFFVEPANDQDIGIPVSELALAPQRALDELCRVNQNIAAAAAKGLFPKPTIWLVRPGTFSDFLQLKLDEGSDNVGQIKVPAVLPRAEYVSWFSHRVVQVL